jgi:hypothetical protein
MRQHRSARDDIATQPRLQTALARHLAHQRSTNTSAVRGARRIGRASTGPYPSTPSTRTSSNTHALAGPCVKTNSPHQSGKETKGRESAPRPPTLTESVISDASGVVIGSIGDNECPGTASGLSDSCAHIESRTIKR